MNLIMIYYKQVFAFRRNTVEIKGQVEDFIFQNEVNSYSIAVLDVGNIDPLTVVRISSICCSW